MAITARLSRRFYDKFGDDIVDELVEWLNQVDLAFRTDLHQANEFAVARMEARIEQRLAEFGAELRGEIQNLGTKIHGEVQDLRSEMHREIHGLKAELIKWVFLFWAGTVLAGVLTR